MSRSASSQSSLRSSSVKRLRTVLFEDEPDNSFVSLTNADAPTPTKQSPLALAKAGLEDIAETLPVELRSVVLEHGSLSISAYALWKQKQTKLQSMKTDASFIPKPLRFKVTADCLPEAKSSQEYRTLTDELAAAVTEASFSLKTYILRATELNVAVYRRRYLRTIADGLAAIAALLLAYYNEESFGRHALVKKYLTSRQTFCADFGTTVAEFSAIYKEAHDYAFFQPPAAAVSRTTAGTPAAAVGNQSTVTPGTADVPAEVFTQEMETEDLDQAAQLENAAQPEEAPRQAEPAILNGWPNMKDYLHSYLSGICQTRMDYEHNQAMRERDLRIKNAVSSIKTKAQTESVAEVLSSELNATPATLEALVEKKIAAKIKSMTKENDTLKKALAKQKQKQEKNPKNSQGARRTGPNNKNKSNDQSTRRSTPTQSTRGRQADGKGNATPGNSSNRGRSRSKSKSGGRNNKSKKRGKSSSGASRRG